MRPNWGDLIVILYTASITTLLVFVLVCVHEQAEIVGWSHSVVTDRNNIIYDEKFYIELRSFAGHRMKRRITKEEYYEMDENSKKYIGKYWCSDKNRNKQRVP